MWISFHFCRSIFQVKSYFTVQDSFLSVHIEWRGNTWFLVWLLETDGSQTSWICLERYSYVANLNYWNDSSWAVFGVYAGWLTQVSCLIFNVWNIQGSTGAIWTGGRGNISLFGVYAGWLTQVRCLILNVWNIQKSTGAIWTWGRGNISLFWPIHGIGIGLKKAGRFVNVCSGFIRFVFSVLFLVSHQY